MKRNLISFFFSYSLVKVGMVTKRTEDASKKKKKSKKKSSLYAFGTAFGPLGTCVWR